MGLCRTFKDKVYTGLLNLVNGEIEVWGIENGKLP